MRSGVGELLGHRPGGAGLHAHLAVATLVPLDAQGELAVAEGGRRRPDEAAGHHHIAGLRTVIYSSPDVEAAKACEKASSVWTSGEGIVTGSALNAMGMVVGFTYNPHFGA